MALRLNITASAFTSVPSVKVMPSRILMVKTVLSSFGVMLSARYGRQLRSLSTVISGSKKVRARIWQNESHCMAAGVHGLDTSASPATTILPP